MRPGSRLVAAQDRDWSLGAVDTGKATSWMEGRLIFEDRPLAEAAAELNRYSAKKIIVRDPAIAGAKVVSVVRAGDVDGFVRVVVAAGFARVASNSDETVELVRPEEKTAGRPAGEVHDF
jgi:transmembrane sensor